MGVEKCNWALCKTPNCLTSNTNSVLWLPVVCEGGCTQFTRKCSHLSWLFWCPPTARRPDFSAIDITKSSPLWAPFLPCILTFFLWKLAIWLRFGQPEPPNSCWAADHPITLSAFQEDYLLIKWSHGTVLSAAMMVALKRVEQDNNCIGCPNN